MDKSVVSIARILNHKESSAKHSNIYCFEQNDSTDSLNT